MIFQAVLWLPGLACIVDKMCCPIAVTFHRDRAVIPGTDHLHLINGQWHATTVDLVAHRPVQLIWNAQYLRLCCIAFFLIAELDRVQSNEIVKEGEQLRKHYQGSISTFAQRKRAMEHDSICSSKPGILHDCTKHVATLVSKVWQRVLNRQTCKIFGRTPAQNQSGIIDGVASILGGTLTSYGPMYLKVTWWIWQPLDIAMAICRVCF